MSINDLCQKYDNYCFIIKPQIRKSLKEKNAQLCIEAANTYYIIKADGGILSQFNKPKSDYMAYSLKYLYIIELKGKSHIDTAYKQIISTIDICLQETECRFLVTNKEKIRACIVGPRKIPRFSEKKEIELFKRLFAISISKQKSKKISDWIYYKDRPNQILELE